MLIRQSRETFATLFKGYAGALVGAAALLSVGVVLRFTGLPATADYAVMGIVLISPFLVALMLRALGKDRRRKHGD
jgi:hypothetical protein